MDHALRLEQHGYGHNDISSLAIVVVAYVVMIAALLVGVTRTYTPPAEPPTVILLPPDTPPPPRTQPVVTRKLPQSQASVLVTTLPHVVITMPTAIAPPIITTTELSPATDTREVQSNMSYPAQRRRAGLQGDVVTRFVVGANGAIRDVTIASSSGSLLNRAVLNVVAQFCCAGERAHMVIEAPFLFSLRD